MAVLTEGIHPGEFLMSEAPGSRSRDVLTVAASEGVLSPGTLMGRVLGASGVGTVTVGKTDVPGANKGVLTLASPAYGTGVREGTYRIIFVEPASNAGTFVVEDPAGIQIGTGNVGTAYDGPIKFTIADGTSDFVSGDVALVSVSFDDVARAGVWRSADPTNTDGSDVARAILLYGVDATSAAVKVAAITRDAEVNVNCLVYDANVDTVAKKSIKVGELARQGIIAR